MNRPKIILYVCASADGRVTMGPNETMFDMLNNPELYDRLIPVGEWQAFMDKMIALYRPQMNLEGSNMVVSGRQPPAGLPVFEGDPKTLFVDYLPDEILKRPGRKTWTAIVDGQGRFRNGYRACEDDPETYMVHLTSRGVSPDYLAFLQSQKIPYLLEGEQHVDLPRMMTKVKEKLGVDTLVTSSGGRLSGALIRQGLLDEINLLVSPVVIGGTETPALFRSPELRWPEIKPQRLTLMDCQKMENDRVWLRYSVKSG